LYLTLSIAAKYKAYSRLKSHTSNSTEKSTRVNTDEPELPPRCHEAQHTKDPSRKRRSSNVDESGGISTPRKAPRQDFVTPSKPPAQKAHPSQIDPYDSPSTLRKLFNPNNHQGDGYQSSSPLPLRAAIGPTPQRDGKALGLFDLLSASGGSRAGETPSARKSGAISGGMIQTPSKQRNVLLADGNDDEVTPRPRRYSLTPASSGKKFLYSNFIATPITLRYSAIEEGGGDKPEAPGDLTGGNSKRKPSASGTPSFLRRTNPLRLGGLKNINETADSTSPIAVRMPPKLVGKGLSTLVKGLRDMEDEKLDDDLDVLRELESEQMGNANNNVAVGDSQVPGNYGEDFPREIGVADGQDPPQPRKQWKKKGQKRTTRRVNMKPVRSKPKPEPKWKANVDDIEEESDSEVGDESMVPETQATTNAKSNNDSIGSDPDSDYGSVPGLSDLDNDDNDDDYDQHEPSKSASRKQRTEPSITETQDGTSTSKLKKSKLDKKSAGEQKENKENEKPKGRKVNPLAHTNFRALKIRNRGSKARGKGGRFGRR
jgi:hypothetical protein